MSLGRDVRTIVYNIDIGKCTTIISSMKINEEVHTVSFDAMCTGVWGKPGSQKTHIDMHVERTDDGDVYVTEVLQWHEYTSIETWKKVK
jgi:hypothetical protein